VEGCRLDGRPGVGPRPVDTSRRGDSAGHSRKSAVCLVELLWVTCSTNIVVTGFLQNELRLSQLWIFCFFHSFLYETYLYVMRGSWSSFVLVQPALYDSFPERSSALPTL
jgi:hypothetical protein